MLAQPTALDVTVETIGPLLVVPYSGNPLPACVSRWIPWLVIARAALECR